MCVPSLQAPAHLELALPHSGGLHGRESISMDQRWSFWEVQLRVIQRVSTCLKVGHEVSHLMPPKLHHPGLALSNRYRIVAFSLR